MRLGLLMRYAGLAGGPPMDQCWRPSGSATLGLGGESYGNDAVTPIAWVLARTTRIKAGTGIMQMSARTPACARHDGGDAAGHVRQPLPARHRPLRPAGDRGLARPCPTASRSTRTKEYIEIVRKVFAREAPLTHKGEHYQIPYAGPDASGLGKPLKSILHPNPSIKIYTAVDLPGRACAPPARSPMACSRSS